MPSYAPADDDDVFDLYVSPSFDLNITGHRTSAGLLTRPCEQ